MTFVRPFFINIILILGGFWSVEVKASLSAKEGEKLEIKCSHTNAHGNIKYFCKDPCSDRDVLISSARKDGNSRYSIRDTGNIFYVTISDLTLSDSGEYWCGVDRVGIDTYSYVLISVTSKSPSNGALQKKTSPETLLYVGVGLGGLLFILLVAVVIFIKHRRREVSKPNRKRDQNQSSREAGNVPLTDTSVCSQKVGPSAPQHHRGSKQEPTSDIYANVQTEGESYSSVHFAKHREDSAAHTDLESTVYSQVKT